MKKTVALILAASLLLTVIGCASTSSVPESHPQDQTVQNSEKLSQSSSSSAQSSQSSSAQTSEPSTTTPIKPSTATPSKPSASQSSSAQSSTAPTPAPQPTKPEPEESPITVADIYGIYQCYAISHSEYEDLSFTEWTITEDALFERGIGYSLFDKACEEGGVIEEGETKEDAWQRLQINQQSLIYQGVRYAMCGGGGTAWSIISITTDSIRCDFAGETKTISFSYEKEHGRLTVLESGLVFEKVYQ